MRNPGLFIVGCERSGTTLLQRMLDSHPQLAIAYETHFLAKAIRGLGGASDAPLDDALVTRIREHRTFGRLGLADGAVDEAAAEAETLKAFVESLYTRFAENAGKAFAGEKSPHYVKLLPELHALLPEARYVHIVRDGRDVALSMLEWELRKSKRPGKGPWALGLWEMHPAAVCALWWAACLRNADRGADALGSRLYREVRYEALVDDPDATLAALCAFAGLPHANEMLAFHEGRTRNDPTLPSKDRWLPPTRGLRDWRTSMSPDDLALFEALVGPVLDAKGYERGASGATRKVQRQADQCLAWWRDHVEHDDMRLPELGG